MNEPLKILEEIRAIAKTGLNYAKGPYDVANYQRLLEIVTKQYASIFEIEPSEVFNRFQKEVGYVTCKLGVNAAVFKGNKILLEQRADDQCWGIPGGWVDVNETPELAIKREILEESALEVQPKEVIEIFSRTAGQFSQPHSSCHILYFCIVEKGELKKSHESLSLGFYELEEIQSWHRDHKSWAESAFRFYRAHQEAAPF